MDEAAVVGPIPKRLIAATDTSLSPEAAAIGGALERGEANE